jgi:hypothetical protein
MRRRNARHGIVRLHIIEHEIAGDADRDGVAEGGRLAEGNACELAEKPVH